MSDGPAPSAVALPAVERTLRGSVVRPGDPDWDSARALWNGSVDRSPALVVRPTGVADVVQVVNEVRERGLALTVRCGGHGIAGHAIRDGAVVLDLRNMNGVRVDPGTRRAHVAGGATWGVLNHETAVFALTAPGITHPEVGVGGYTLGGGIGPLARSQGLAIDALRSVDVVTAAGRWIHASETAHSDLFWALRGGGGGVGVVTTLEFDLQPIETPLLRGGVLYPMEDAVAVLQGYRDFFARAPDEVQCYASFVQGGAAFDIAEPHRGRPMLMLSMTYRGPIDRGQAVLEPLRHIVEPVFDGVGVQPFHDGTAYPPGGERNHYSSRFLTTLSDGAIDTLVELATPLPGRHSALTVCAMGGAINRVQPTAMAFPHRTASFLVGVYAHWSDLAQDSAARSWSHRLCAALAPFATGGEYLNNQTEGGEASERAAFGINHERLSAVRAEWDPDGLFRPSG